MPNIIVTFYFKELCTNVQYFEVRPMGFLEISQLPNVVIIFLWKCILMMNFYRFGKKILFRPSIELMLLRMRVRDVSWLNLICEISFRTYSLSLFPKWGLTYKEPVWQHPTLSYFRLQLGFRVFSTSHNLLLGLLYIISPFLGCRLMEFDVSWGLFWLRTQYNYFHELIVI